MCLFPQLINNRKYTANKKNGGVIPAVSDKRTKLVPVGCGKCMECMKKKSREWQVRLMEEIRDRKDGVFVTLTFSNEQIKYIAEGKDTNGEQIWKWVKNKNNKGNKPKKYREFEKPIELEGYELDNEIAKIAVRRFLERWRKKYKKSVRHWLVTELGHNGTENLHLHGIIWTEQPKSEIDKIWGYGYTWIGDEKRGGWVNEQTVNYIVKYIHKIDEVHKEYKPRILTSAGIGSGYLKRMDRQRNEYVEGKTKEFYVTRDGLKMALPIYYRNHIYTEEQREKLWIEKLDKQVRYINGQEIDISQNEEDYYRTLEEARIKNKRLGYGDNSINWDRKIYERERRMLNYKKRKGL